MDLLNFFLIFTKLCILLENKEKKFGVRGTLMDPGDTTKDKPEEENHGQDEHSSDDIQRAS